MIPLDQRIILIDWIYELSSVMIYSRQIIHTAIMIMDKYCKNNTVEKNKIQLIGICSLIIASRYYSPCGGMLTKEGVYYCSDIYTDKEINGTIIIILKTIGYKVVYYTLYENLYKNKCNDLQLYLSDFIMISPLLLNFDNLTEAIQKIFELDEDSHNEDTYISVIYLSLIEYRSKNLTGIYAYNKNNELKIPNLIINKTLFDIQSSLIFTDHDINIIPEPLEKGEKLKFLGHGSYGKVHTYRVNNKLYAIKTTSKDDNNLIIPTILMETNAFLRLKHPHIIQLYDFSFSNNKMSFVMELMDTTLYDLDKSILSKETKFSYIQQLLDGVKYIHNNKMMHRDLSPKNIFISKDILKIGDLGTCIYYINKLSYDPIVCTLHYAPPEILSLYTKYDLSIDIWSIGCNIYFILENKELFNKYDDILVQIFSLFGLPPTNISLYIMDKYKNIKKKNELSLKKYPEKTKIIEKMLSLDPKERPTIDEIMTYF